MSLSRIALALLGGTGVLAAGGCAVDSGPNFGYRTSPAPILSQAAVQQESPAPNFYRTHQTAAYGSIYTTADGRALYFYRRDRLNESRCYGQCARRWQPYLAYGGVRARGNWSIIDREDGTRQWAYAGRPTYTWSGDREPGAITGHGRDGTWSVMRVPQS